MKTLFLSALLVSSSLFASDYIKIDTCYGSASKLVVSGRIFKEKQKREKLKTDGIWTNIKRSFGYLAKDEIKDSQLTVLADGQYFHIRSDNEGYFIFESTAHKNSYRDHQGVTITIDESNASASCNAMIATGKKQVGVISDFDDTLVISNVTNKLKLLKNSLLRNYKQRTPVKGMNNRFTKIFGSQKPFLFIITGSPRQLQEPIEKFLDFHDFPKRTIIAKKVHGDNNDRKLSQLEYKYSKIKPLMDMYPHTSWVFFGDSGEKDLEVYKIIRDEYPSRVRDIYIRDVKSGKIKQIK